MSKRRMTAADLMAELERDRAFQRDAAERQRRYQLAGQKCDALLAPIIARLNHRGFGGDSIEEIVRRNAPLPDDAVEILRKGVVGLKEDRAVETLVRALGAAANPFDGSVLVDCFERTSDEGLKWAVINTVALTRPLSIDEWLAATLKHDEWGKTLRSLGYRDRKKKARRQPEEE